MIMPVRQILERADKRQEIGAKDVFISTVQGFLDYLSCEVDYSSGLEQFHSGLLEARDLIQARMAVVPIERQTTLAAILDILDKEINKIEGGKTLS
jgi:hypothetical protein